MRRVPAPHPTCVLFAALLSSCSEGDRNLTVNLPDSVDYWAAIVTDDRGEVSDASGLIGRDQPLSFSATDRRDGQSVIVVGFSAESLKIFAPPDASAAETPLRSTAGCEPDLGPPTWQIVLDGPERSAPRLTSSWVQSACLPILPADQTGFFALCGEEYCGQSWKQRQCTIEIQFGQCVLPALPETLIASLRPDGLCVNEGGSCSVVDTIPPAIADLECQLGDDVCGLELFLPGERNAKIDRVPLVTEPSYTSELGTGLPREELLVGYLAGLVVTSSRVYTSVQSRASKWFHETPPTARLVGIDRATLEVVLDEPMPAGFWPALADPRGDGLISLHRAGTSVVISRRSSNGRVVVSSTVAFEPGDDSLLVPLSLRYDPLEDRLVLGSSRRGLSERSLGAFVHAFDPDTLTQEVSCELPMAWLQGLVVDGSRIAIADSNLDGVSRLDLDACEIVDWASLGYGLIQTTGLVKSPIANELLVFLNGAQVADGIAVFDHVGLRTQAGWYERSAFPTAVTIRKDGSPFELWVTLGVPFPSGSESMESELVLFDAEHDRFLPGAIALGSGLAPEIDTDKDGNVWTILTWTGEVLRVRPDVP